MGTRSNDYAVRVLSTRKVGNHKGENVKGQDLEWSHAGAAVRDDSLACMRMVASCMVRCPFRVMIGKSKTSKPSGRLKLFVGTITTKLLNTLRIRRGELSLSDKVYVIASGRADIQSRRILTSIRKHHADLNATSQDIYNVRHLHRFEMLVDRPPL